MRRIEFGHFLIIAEGHTGVPAKQLARIDSVLTLGQAALAAPFAGFGDTEVFPNFHEKAAIYCARIVTYHPLPDGNKRSGFQVMVEFIERNGRSFGHDSAGWEHTAEIIEGLAAGTIDEGTFVDWVSGRIG